MVAGHREHTPRQTKLPSGIWFNISPLERGDVQTRRPQDCRGKRGVCSRCVPENPDFDPGSPISSINLFQSLFLSKRDYPKKEYLKSEERRII
jgi:hypothetical protein